MNFLFELLEARCLLAATHLRIDSGGAGATETSGKVWEADRSFTAGTAAGTADDLYGSRRFGDFSYSLPIRNGSYKVKFLFKDPIFSAAGQRKFDVFAEGKIALNDFDIAAVGGNGDVVKTVTVNVSDRKLNLWFQSVKDNAIVSAIEVTPATSSINWKPIADAPIARFESMGEVVDDKLYVFGGYATASIKATAQLAVYDPVANTWATRNNMPQPLSHSGIASDFQYIYLAGGYVGDWIGRDSPLTRKVWRYDTLNDTWTSMLQLPADRSAGGLVRVGRKLHYFGGLDRHKRDRAEHWVLDLRNPTKWVEAAPLPNPRNHLGFAELGGKIYAIGGQHDLDETDGNEAAVHAFDVVTGMWDEVAALPVKVSHQHNATFVMDGKLVTVGGSTQNSQPLQSILEYDPANNQWRTLGQLPLPLSATVAVWLNGHIVVTGGTNAGSVPRAQSYIDM